MNQDTVQAIENSIEQAKEIRETGSALERLRSNRDFRRVVLTGYFEKEAIRLVHLKADPGMQSMSSQASIVAQIDAIGTLSQYFNTVFQLADMAQKAVDSGEAELEELQAEGSQQ